MDLVLVTGGAGYIGSHVVEILLIRATMSGLSITVCLVFSHFIRFMNLDNLN